jgi:hypothetical protein
MDLTTTLSEMARGMGASLVGVAPVERFDGAPPAHHPAELLPGARTVVTFGIRILDRVMAWPELLKGSPFYPESKRAEALRLCLYEKSGYQIINDHLNTIALRLATHLEEMGHASLFFPTTNTGVPEEYAHVPAMFSHRHAAVRAGLGEFGLNNVVVTARYGPRDHRGAADSFTPTDRQDLRRPCLSGVRAAMSRWRAHHAARGCRERSLAGSSGADRVGHLPQHAPGDRLYGAVPSRLPRRPLAGTRPGRT